MNQLDQYSQVQTYNISQVVIKAPRERVWPYMLDFSSYNDSFEKIELLVGEPNKVGAISRLTKRKGQWWIPPYLAKIIHIQEGHQIVWKTYPEEGDDSSAFVDFSLTEIPDGTLFAIRHYKENRISIRTPDQLVAFSEQINATAVRLHHDLSFPNLKRLVERHPQ